MTYVLAPWRPRWRQPLRSPRETPRVGVLETSLHEIVYARERENGRRNKEARRNGEQVEGGEIDTRGSPRGIRITSGCRNYWPVGRGRAANGTGCFALVEMADKSRKLNRRHRLSIGVPRGRRTRRVGHKENRFIISLHRIRGYLDTRGRSENSRYRHFLPNNRFQIS